MKEITLSKGKTTFVDDCDYNYIVSLGSWFADRTMSGIESYYAAKKINNKTVRMHRLIMECIAGPIPRQYSVDHIDNNGLNNTRINLRICEHRRNIANKRKTYSETSSKYKGVYFNKRKSLWAATVKVNYKKIHLGYFADEKDAGKAYNTGAVKYFGEFANLNIIE